MYFKRITPIIGLALLLFAVAFWANNVKAITCDYADESCYDDGGDCNSGYYCLEAPTSLPVSGGCGGDPYYDPQGDDCGTCVKIAWPHSPQGQNCGPSLAVEDYACW